MKWLFFGAGAVGIELNQEVPSEGGDGKREKINSIRKRTTNKCLSNALPCLRRRRKRQCPRSSLVGQWGNGVHLEDRPKWMDRGAGRAICKGSHAKPMT